MAVFSKVATTTLGLNLYAKVQAGAALNFTRMQIGGGQLPAGNDPAAQTALITPIAYFAINSISTNLNTANIKGIFENTLINVDTYTCELGLFATDPDLGEILYAYANALAQGDTIPPHSSGPLSKQFQINAAIGNSANVTATIPATTYVPTSDKGIANGVATLDATIKIPIAQIPNMDIAHLPTGIPAIKLADGSITDTELEYINSLTSNAQTQITAIKTTADAAATNAALTAHEADYTEHVPYGGATTGPANTYALATPAIAALSVGMAVSMKFNVDSTAASTLNWNGKGAKGIKKSNGTDVTNLKATGIYTLRYDGTNFILQGEGGSGNAIAAHLLAGETASTDAGDIVGTMPNNGAGGTVTPGTANQTRAAGFWSSLITILGDVNLLAQNILAGKTIFGVAGSAPAKATGSIASASSGNLLTVSGLAFQPSVVIVEWNPGTWTRATYNLASNSAALNGSYVNAAGAGGVGGTFTMNASGFTLSGIVSNSATCFWTAVQ